MGPFISSADLKRLTKKRTISEGQGCQEKRKEREGTGFWGAAPATLPRGALLERAWRWGSQINVGSQCGAGALYDEDGVGKLS